MKKVTVLIGIFFILANLSLHSKEHPMIANYDYGTAYMYVGSDTLYPDINGFSAAWCDSCKRFIGSRDSFFLKFPEFLNVKQTENEKVMVIYWPDAAQKIVFHQTPDDRWVKMLACSDLEMSTWGERYVDSTYHIIDVEKMNHGSMNIIYTHNGSKGSFSSSMIPDASFFK